MKVSFFRKSLLLVVAIAAVWLLPPGLRAEAQEKYSNGVFLLNEDWYGHKNGSLNFLDFSESSPEWRYRVYQNENSGKEFGVTAQFGAIYGGNLFVVSKQSVNSVGGGVLVVADAGTLKMRDFKLEPEGMADGRSCVGVDEKTLYLGTAKGIFVYDIPSKKITKKIVASENGIGNMVRGTDYVFALSNKVGLLVIDPIKHEVIKTLAPEGPKMNYTFIRITPDGQLNVGRFGPPDWSTDCLVRIDQHTLEITKEIQISTQKYRMPNWDDRNGAVCAAKTSNTIYWVGTSTASAFEPVQPINVLKLDLDAENPTPELFYEVTGGLKIYGSGIELSPDDEYLYLSLFKDFGDMSYTVSRVHLRDKSVENFPLTEQHYWFPAMFIFPDNEAPVVQAAKLPTEIVLSNASPSYELDLSDVVTDADNLSCIIVKSCEVENSSLLTATIKHDKLELTRKGTGVGVTNLVLSFNSNGKIVKHTVKVRVGVSYTIVFNANGGEGTMDPLVMEYGESKKLTANKFKRTSYTFMGWNTQSNGEGTQYADRAEVKNLTSEHGGTVNLYAQWAMVVHRTILCHEYMPAPGQFINKLPAWAEGESADDVATKATVEINEGRLITLGAWGGYVVMGLDKPIYNVAGKRDFRVNGNAFGNSPEPAIVLVSKDINGNGEPDDPWYEIKGSEWDNPETKRNYELTYYRPVAEPADKSEWPTYIRWTDNYGNEGYVQKNGWHAQSYWPGWHADKETLVFKGTRLPNAYELTSVDPEYWTGTPFGYGYVDNLPNNDPEAPLDIADAVLPDGTPVYLDQIDFIKVYNATNQYAGWLGEVSTEVSGVFDMHGDATAAAHLVKVEQGEGTELVILYEGAQFHSDTRLPAGSEIKVSGKALLGYSAPVFKVGGVEVSDGSVYTVNSDVTISLTATPNTYSIAFASNEGAGEMSSVSVKYGEDKQLPANTFERVGYTFLGWSTESTGAVVYENGAEVKNLTTVDGATVTLYAQWRAITYTVGFNGNGGDGEMPSFILAYDVPKKLARNAFSRSGYRFVGWNTAADGSGDAIEDGAEVKNLTAVDGTTVTLYAQWIRLFTVTYATPENGELEVNDPAGDVVASGAEVAVGTVLTITAMSNDGYKLKSLTVNGVNFTNGGTHEVKGDVVVAAVFKRKSYTVTFESNGGSPVPSATVEHGSKVSRPDDPTREGYNFAGWYSDVALQTEYDFSSQVKGELTLYAKWTEKVYTITLTGTNCQIVATVGEAKVERAAAGAVVSLTVTSEGEYTEFKSLTIHKKEDGSDVTSQVGYDADAKTFTMPAYAVEVKAVFVKPTKYTITAITVEGAGLVTVTAADGTELKVEDKVKAGELLSITATSNDPDKYELSSDSIKVAGATRESDGRWKVTGNVTISAKFVEKTTPPATQEYTITAITVDGPGTVSVANAAGEALNEGAKVKAGDLLTITAKATNPATHELSSDGIQVTGATEADGKWKVGGDVTISVRFVEKQPAKYTITFVVKDAEGVAVEGATVKVKGVTGSKTTTADGKAEFADLAAGEITYSVSKEGYEPMADQKYTVSKSEDVNVTLKAMSTSVDSEVLNLTLFPNPAAAQITLVGLERASQVTIFNQLGGAVLSVLVQPNQSIDVSALPAGVYLLQAEGVVLRFVKE